MTNTGNTERDLYMLQKAVESSGEAIFVTDYNGIITYINSGFTNLYGYSAVEVIGKTTPRILKSGLMTADDYKSFWSTIKNKKIARGEIINKTKDGRLITVEGSANPVINDQEELIGFIGIQHDITSRKQSEEALKLSEEKFRKAFMISPDSVNINRLSDGMFISVNEGFTNILGYTEGESVGKTSLELNIWADPENRKTLAKALQEKGSIENFEAIFRNKNGSIVIGLMSASLIDLNGVPHILNITKDITARKRIEEELAREQFLVNALMNNLPDHIYFKDKESRFIRNNSSHVKSFGFDDPAQLVGKSDFDFFAEPAARQAYDDEQKIIRTGQSIFKEEQLTRKDNTVAWFSAMKLPLRDKNGDIIGTFGISRDITERKKIEDALIHSEERFRSVAESASDAIITADSNVKIIGWNKGAEKIVGYTESEIKGQSLDLLIHEDYRDQQSKIIELLKMGGGKYMAGKTVEFLGVKKNGIVFPVEMSFSGWKTSEGQFFTGILRDITSRKRAELENQVNYEITQGITTTNNLDELLKLIHTSLGKMVYAENCFVALYNKKTGLFSFPYFVDKIDPAPMPASMGKSCSAYVFRTVKPLLLTQKIFNQLLEQDEVELVGSNSPSWDRNSSSDTVRGYRSISSSALRKGKCLLRQRYEVPGLNR
jgi:PAS domain S-box-containing protein